MYYHIPGEADLNFPVDEWKKKQKAWIMLRVEGSGVEGGG